MDYDDAQQATDKAAYVVQRKTETAAYYRDRLQPPPSKGASTPPRRF
ncbi:hypothetical protein OG333_36865 [Streptomyces anulatus]|nr:hypothetical protein OG333_36865 [Streptomyces anulatus]